MVIVRLNGGLGNQMFQYALGRHLAECNSTLLKLDLSPFETYKLRSYALHCFRIWEHVATIEESRYFNVKRIHYLTTIASKIGERFRIFSTLAPNIYLSPVIIREENFTYDHTILERKGNIYLEGYWQSEKYFSPIRDILLREFSFKYDQNTLNRVIGEQIQNTESISLHIRRGDYVNNALTNQVHGLCSIDYYKRAINHLANINKKCHLFVFSDDQSWVDENFKFDLPVTFVDHNSGYSSFEDLRLMSLCKNNIIANSSFSWWGAWLNTNPDKIIIAPTKWFNDPSLDTSDLIPETWLRM